MRIEQRLAELGITLPPTTPPVANYVRTVRTGNLLFVSGQTAMRDGRPLHPGKLGRDVTVEQGYEAARQIAIGLLGAVRDALGDLDRVRRSVKLLGMVNSAEDFGDQPKVINGASDLLVEVFGEAGRHARSAVGMGALPGNASVEIEMIVEVEP